MSKETSERFDIGNPPERVIWNGKPHNSFSVCQDPTEHLVQGRTYKVDRVSVHSWHTRVYLEDFPNK